MKKTNWMTQPDRLLTMGLMAALAFAACKSIDQANGGHQKETIKRIYPVEIYGDLEIFDSPRLQFVWQPKDEDLKSVWSMKLDGSDLRRTVEPELFFKYGDLVQGRPMRSPDNRYLAVSLDTIEGWIHKAVLFDLKEKTARVMSEDFFYMHYQWTDDSKQVWFYKDRELVQFDVDKNELSKRPMIPSTGYYFLPGKEQVLAMKTYGFDIRKFNGKLIKKVMLTDYPEIKWVENDHALHQDGRRLYYCHRWDAFVIDIEKPNEKIYEGDKPCVDVIFSNNADEIICEKKGIISFNFVNWKRKTLEKFEAEETDGYQLINLNVKRK